MGLHTRSVMECHLGDYGFTIVGRYGFAEDFCFVFRTQDSRAKIIPVKYIQAP